MLRFLCEHNVRPDVQKHHPSLRVIADLNSIELVRFLNFRSPGFGYQPTHFWRARDLSATEIESMNINMDSDADILRAYSTLSTERPPQLLPWMSREHIEELQSNRTFLRFGTDRRLTAQPTLQKLNLR